MEINEILKERLNRMISLHKEVTDAYIREYKGCKNTARLHMKRCRGNIIYCEYKNGKQKSITKDTDRVYQLVRIAYFKEKAKQAKEIRICLENAIEHIEEAGYPEDMISRLSLPDTDRIMTISNEWKWLQNNTCNSDHMPESLLYVTQKGVRMRSKSERTIGNYLESRGIRYAYEKPIYISGITYHPDFTIRKYDGTEVIWEHFGLMNNEVYYRNMISKILHYMDNGYRVYKDLIFTVEDDLVDMGALDDIVYRYIIS